MFDDDSIVKFDKLDNLELYHYDRCDINSPNNVKSNRGIIIERKDDEYNIVCRSFGYTPLFTTDQEEEFTKEVNTIFKDANKDFDISNIEF